MLSSREMGLAFAHAPMLEDALDRAQDVLGLALAPMAGRMAEVALGAEDYAVEVPGFADAWFGPYPSDRAVEPIVELAGKRLLSTATVWDDTTIAALLVTPLATGGSLVLVRNVEDASLARKVETERVDTIVSLPSIAATTIL